MPSRSTSAIVKTVQPIWREVSSHFRGVLAAADPDDREVGRAALRILKKVAERAAGRRHQVLAPELIVMLVDPDDTGLRLVEALDLRQREGRERVIAAEKDRHGAAFDDFADARRHVAHELIDVALGAL
jgi:hypothetical protein